MDGIVAMEGNGPRSGQPRQMNVLLFSDDPIAMDATACRIIGLDPEIVPTSALGERAGLGKYHREDIDIVGDGLESFIDNDFEVNRTAPVHCSTGRVRAFIKNRICEKPFIDKTTCTSCGVCVQMCPVEPKALEWHGGYKESPPTYRYDRCIRCYCCQENCPVGAISVEKPLLSGIISRL
jgi:Pyruvate/2-oxoacid:ferredoxin oxidoreductase delta subunit